MSIDSGDDIPEIPTIVVGPWIADGLCGKVEDPDLFFPRQGSKGTRARRICAQCPVKRECLEYALAANEEYGIWGGLDAMERASLKRRRQRERQRRKAAETATRKDGAA